MSVTVGSFVVPIVELAVIIQVGQEIGVLPTIAILVADSILGSLLMRSQGRAAWRRFNTAISSGRPPARGHIDQVRSRRRCTRLEGTSLASTSQIEQCHGTGKCLGTAHIDFGDHITAA